MTVSLKLPRQPPADISARTPDWVDWPIGSPPLWQVVNTAGPYAVRFGRMRSFGPLASARFDPHPPPAGDHPTERVLYAASDLATALAERFRHSREIRGSAPDAPGVYAWTPNRPLRLVDLRDTGALRLGASHTLSTGPRSITRTWAQAIRAAWPDADGLAYTSSMSGRSCLTLWAPAADSFPAAPDFAKLLSDPAAGWQFRVQSAAVEIGYTHLH